MKKKVLVLLVAFLVIGASLFAAPHKIGILAPAVTHGWSAGVAYYAEQKCQELEAQGIVDYMIYTSSNSDEMTTQLDDLILWGAEAIVAFPQWTGMEVPIQNAINMGVVVVNFDIEIAAEGVYRVSGDNYNMGEEGAKYIVDKIGPEGTVVILDVPTSGSVAELRKAGFLDTLAEIAPDMETITDCMMNLDCHWNPDDITFLTISSYRENRFQVIVVLLQVEIESVKSHPGNH